MIHSKRNRPRIDDQPLVYNMGKVGSVSVQVALRKKGLRTRHAHYMVDPKHGEYNTDKPGLVQEIKKRDRVWNVISLAREPVARNISAFFYTLHETYPKYKLFIYDPEMIEIFLKTYKHDYVLNWFDTELKKLFKIDVYDYEFPHEKGWQILTNDFVRLLVLRTEDLTLKGYKGIEKLLHLKNVEVGISNDTKSRGRIAQMYDDFKDDIKLPKDYLDWIYSSKYAQHFYTNEEIALFKMRWGDKM